MAYSQALYKAVFSSLKRYKNWWPRVLAKKDPFRSSKRKGQLSAINCFLKPSSKSTKLRFPCRNSKLKLKRFCRGLGGKKLICQVRIKWIWLMKLYNTSRKFLCSNCDTLIVNSRFVKINIFVVFFNANNN